MTGSRQRLMQRFMKRKCYFVPKIAIELVRSNYRPLASLRSLHLKKIVWCKLKLLTKKLTCLALQIQKLKAMQSWFPYFGLASHQFQLYQTRDRRIMRLIKFLHMIRRRYDNQSKSHLIKFISNLNTKTC